MDQDLIELIKAMDSIIDSIEKIDKFENNSRQLNNSIQEALRVITECSGSINGYLSDNRVGMCFTCRCEGYGC